MMPVIRLNDATFVDLKIISTWIGTNTPAETIAAIVRDKMDALDLERDVDDANLHKNNSGEDLVFEKAPGLSFTRILSTRVNDGDPDKLNWAGLLMKVIGIVKAKGLSGEKLVTELQIPAKASEYTKDGYKFYSELGISIQGQSAPDAWKEVSRLADKFRIPVEVRFQWRDNEKAQHPGKIGVIRAGS
ncbi:T4SS efffector SepA family protein [Pseudomonadota bacterium]